MCREHTKHDKGRGIFPIISLFLCHHRSREEESWFWGFLFASSAVIGNACRTKNWLMLLSLTCAQPPTASSLETELLSIHTKVCTGKIVEYYNTTRYLCRYLLLLDLKISHKDYGAMLKETKLFTIYIFLNYAIFWSISLDNFIKHKLLISECRAPTFFWKDCIT